MSIVNYRHRLNSKRGKFTCPECGEPKRYSRFEDTRTGELLPEEFGKCDRENSCGYFLSPYHKDEEGNNYAKKIWLQESQNKPYTNRKRTDKPKLNMETPISTLPIENVLGTFDLNERNELLNFLKNKFGKKPIDNLIQMYCVGTMPDGSCIFYQIDGQGQIRTGKIMSYDQHTGQRVKSVNGQAAINWIHSVWHLNDYQLKQCFFGEHLLAEYSEKPVAIVESEKTALIASQYLPDFLWLACGGSMGLTDEKCQVLQGRQVVLFPDLSPDGSIYMIWEKKADKFGFKISNLLENKAWLKERQYSLDIADYLIKYDLIR